MNYKQLDRHLNINGVGNLLALAAVLALIAALAVAYV